MIEPRRSGRRTVPSNRVAQNQEQIFESLQNHAASLTPQTIEPAKKKSKVSVSISLEPASETSPRANAAHASNDSSDANDAKQCTEAGVRQLHATAHTDVVNLSFTMKQGYTFDMSDSQLFQQGMSQVSRGILVSASDVSPHKVNLEIATKPPKQPRLQRVEFWTFLENCPMTPTMRHCDWTAF
jgi:hypothetical protein